MNEIAVPARVIRVRSADLVIRAGAIYSMNSERAVFRSIAIRDEWIVAASEDPHGLDGLVSDGARVIDDPGLTVIPALDDDHNHFILAGANLSQIQAVQAHNIAELLDMIRVRAAHTPPGQWIQTASNWDESNLAEKRLPTGAELDRATSDHPVWVVRGGHVGIANTLALKLAGVTAQTPDPPHGTIRRDPDGSPTGELYSAPAMSLVTSHIPPPPFDEQLQELRQASRLYSSLGIGTVRDPIVTRDQLLVYQALRDRGELTVRSRIMFLMRQGSVADCISDIGSLGVRSGFGDDWLRIWGLKTLMDGGPAAAALDQPFSNNPKSSGTPFWKVSDLVEVGDYAVRRGWRIGIHAIGDRAVRTVLDAYEEITQHNPGLKPGTLVIEHPFLADAIQRERARKLGVAISVQHPLLYAQAPALLAMWGKVRVAQILPISAWVNDGVQVSAGTDSPPSDVNPLLAVWGMVTRGTNQAGVQGAEYAVDRWTAFQLYTVGSAALDWESEWRGTIEPRRLADLVAYRIDPMTCAIEDLPKLRPSLTMVGGRPTYDPTELITAAGSASPTISP